MRFIQYATMSAIFLILMASPPAYACNVCHSKNPKMARMHEALGFRDCFICHGPGSKRIAQQQSVQMTSDPLCVNCHKK